MVKCDVCGEYEARYVCKLCGRRVCTHDYVFEQGICVVCRATKCEICGLYPAISYCRICGRVGCEECLIQVSLVSYVCKECMRKGIGLHGAEGREAS